MEDGSEDQARHQGPVAPPRKPDPEADTLIKKIKPAYVERSNKALTLSSPEWDVNSISALAALRMFSDALETLADATGDVPPTPPISRPTTPLRDSVNRKGSETSSIPPITIGSPEAHPHEPIRVVGAGAEEHTIQHAMIARRFFSKVAPPFSLQEYLNRLHHWCPHSPGVYLAAASYCYRLCVEEYMMPATKRTVHRLALTAIRIAAKALEDNKWTQDRISKVGGVGPTQLLNLEISLCFLLDFDLWVDESRLSKSMFQLQQAGSLGRGARGKLSDFKLRLDPRRKVASVPVAATT